MTLVFFGTKENEQVKQIFTKNEKRVLLQSRFQHRIVGCRNFFRYRLSYGRGFSGKMEGTIGIVIPEL
jgi:hypothetical protein